MSNLLFRFNSILNIKYKPSSYGYFTPVHFINISNAAPNKAVWKSLLPDNAFIDVHEVVYLLTFTELISIILASILRKV